MTTMQQTPPSRAAVPASPDVAPVIRARGLQYHYEDYHAVRDVDLSVGRGEVFALLGTNGAGKTTTLELLQGFRARSGGELSVFGVDPRRQPGLVRANTGVVLQESGHFGELSVTAELRHWGRLSSREDSVDRVLELVDLTGRADNRIDTLSGGERRRLDLAMALWGSPQLVILDEPTTGLDAESRQTLWAVVEQLRDRGTAVVLTTHYLEEAEQLADRVAIMHAGGVAVHGTLDEVLATRPSRILAELPHADGERLAGLAPAGVEVGWDQRRRAARPDHGVLQVASSDQQQSVAWFMQAVAAERITLGPLRATPASLEEVFLAVRAGEIGAGAVDGDDHAHDDIGHDHHHAELSVPDHDREDDAR